MTFDWKKPTAQMLGRWQPWHKGHTEIFKKALEVNLTSLSNTDKKNNNIPK